MVRSVVKAVFGVDIPILEKRRFQHGAIAKESLRQRIPAQEAKYRREFMALYS